MNIDRRWWVERIEALWRERPIVWLAGVRRMGKTTLARQVPAHHYWNCDLPSVQRSAADPELFLDGCAEGQRLVLDEIHRLEDPALLLKLAADTRPDLRVLATGSSTLAASERFSDTLSGRKHSLHLPAVLWHETIGPFGVVDLQCRLLHGGFPEQLLAAVPSADFFEEWIESFFARDLQTLYGLRDRHGYRQLVMLLACQSGGQLAVSDVANRIDLSRPTVMSYLDALEDSHAITRLPPYHGGGAQEVARRPRCFLMDTGLVAHLRGWSDLSDGRDGLLWEHLVLDQLLATEPRRCLHYWRTHRGDEVDFVVERSDGSVDAIEAKVDPDRWSGTALAAFRQRHPQGRNVIVTPHRSARSRFRSGELLVEVIGLADMGQEREGWGLPAESRW